MVVRTIQIEKNTKTTNAIAESFCNFKSSVEIVLNIDDKVYFETYYHHTPSQVQINKTTMKI